jgi:hypothetical protein
MSEINAIATNNYILHNIDAKKLYVQEPLFTANSGDAVYVGWRPDETVLWSGYTTITNPVFNLSGNVDDFEYIEMYAVDDDGWCGYTKVETNYCTTANRIPVIIGHFNTGSKKFITRGIYVHPTSVSSFDGKAFGFDYVNNATENDKTHMTKIIGINRKENA